MGNCTFCYKTVEHGFYHPKCCKNIFGTTVLPELLLDKKLIEDLAKFTVNQRIAITGVQPKLSVKLESIQGSGKRLTIVGLWGKAFCPIYVQTQAAFRSHFSS